MTARCGVDIRTSQRPSASTVVSPGIGRSTVLKLAALLHDIGKPATKSVDPDGRIRFFGHSAAGSDIAGSVLKRLRLPTRVVDHVTAMITPFLAADLLKALLAGAVIQRLAPKIRTLS